jgi:hypothetical protein
VIGAVASWGRLQVHGAGFRAAHACDVTLAYHAEVDEQGRAALNRIAERYRVEAVPVDLLEQAATQHGSPLPETLPAPAEPLQSPAPDPVPVLAPDPAPDLSPEEASPPAARARSRSPLSLIDPLAPHRRASRRTRLWFLAFEACVALALVVLAIATFGSESHASFVQQHGIAVTGRVKAVRSPTSCTSYVGMGPCSNGTDAAVSLARPVDGVRTVDVAYGHLVPVKPGQTVDLLLDPRNPRYAELTGRSRSPGGVWIAAAVLALAVIAGVIVDARSVLRSRRHHPHPAAA